MIPRQLRAIREAEGMTQQALADAAHTTQTVISRIEKGSGGNLTIKSLLNLAGALDVALVVRFEAVDHFITWTESLSFDDMAPRRSQLILEELEKEAAAHTAEELMPPMRANAAIVEDGANSASLEVGAKEMRSLSNVVDFPSPLDSSPSATATLGEYRLSEAI